MGGQTNPRLDGDIEQSCFAEWREGAKCADWTFPYKESESVNRVKWEEATVEERKQMAAENALRKGSEDDCCCPPPKEWEGPKPPTLDEEFIRLKFKLSMNFDSFTPSQSAGAARYKLREITDEQANEFAENGEECEVRIRPIKTKRTTMSLSHISIITPRGFMIGLIFLERGTKTRLLLKIDSILICPEV